MPKKEIWALDLGAWSTKIARARRLKSGEIVVNLYDEINYHEQGIETDGEFLSGVSEAMEEFAQRHTINPADDLCVSVSGNGVFSRFINLPPVPESVDEIIQYEARQQIPFDMDQVVWDYQPVKTDYAPWEEVKVGLFALKSETVSELMAILSSWRSNLRIVQQAPLSVYNFLTFEGFGDEPAVVIDMGGQTTSVIVIDPPEFWLRSLLVGGDVLTERIESHFGISRREAERVKSRAGESGRSAQILRVAGKPLSDLLSEIQRSLGYYKSLSPEVKLDKIIGVGNAFRLKGIDKVVSDGLQCKVEVVKRAKNITLTEEVESNIGSGFCGCCSLFGLLTQRVGEGRVTVNLVPKEIAFENEMRKKKPYLIGAALGLLAVLGVLIFGEMLYGRRLETQKGVGTNIPGQVQTIEREYSTVNQRVRNLKNTLEELSGDSVRRDLYMHVTSELTRAMPHTELQISEAMLPEAVYLNELRLHWVPESGYENVMREEMERETDTSEIMREPRGRRQPDRRGRDIYDRDEDRQQTLAGATWDHVAGEDSVLVVEAVFESSVVRQAMLDRVINSLKENRYAETGRPVFRDVQLVGSPRRIYRDSRTGELVSDSSELQFMHFSLMAGVNNMHQEYSEE